eukprot:8754-Prymnesium_polylepis.2
MAMHFPVTVSGALSTHLLILRVCRVRDASPTMGGRRAKGIGTNRPKKKKPTIDTAPEVIEDASDAAESFIDA